MRAHLGQSGQLQAVCDTASYLADCAESGMHCTPLPLPQQGFLKANNVRSVWLLCLCFLDLVLVIAYMYVASARISTQVAM